MHPHVRERYACNFSIYHGAIIYCYTMSHCITEIRKLHNQNLTTAYTSKPMEVVMQTLVCQHRSTSLKPHSV